MGSPRRDPRRIRQRRGVYRGASLPTRGALSDSFIDAAPAAGVTWFSWVTALLEILADLLFGAAGVAVLAAWNKHRSPITQA
jgi:hypothetical protein